MTKLNNWKDIGDAILLEFQEVNQISFQSSATERELEKAKLTLLTVEGGQYQITSVYINMEWYAENYPIT